MKVIITDKLKEFLPALLVILCMAGISCKKEKVKNNPPGPGPGQAAYSFANTQWTGVAATYGQVYNQPCYLRFDGDTAVSVYVLFSWIIGNDIVTSDSITGKITAIDTSDNITTVSVNFPFTDDQQVYTITGKNTLSGGSSSTTRATVYTSFKPSLQLCPATIAPVAGTAWTTDIIQGGGSQVDGRQSFPDLATLSFNDNNKMSYYRNGQPVAYTPPTQDQLLIEGYQQIGPRLSFAGFNEEADFLVQYYGVLLADGNTILADTRSGHARLPSYIETFHYYGFPGQTPTMHKAK